MHDCAKSTNIVNTFWFFCEPKWTHSCVYYYMKEWQPNIELLDSWTRVNCLRYIRMKNILTTYGLKIVLLPPYTEWSNTCFGDSGDLSHTLFSYYQFVGNCVVEMRFKVKLCSNVSIQRPISYVLDSCCHYRKRGWGHVHCRISIDIVITDIIANRSTTP